ncbi:MAG TPA: PLD nuclease N-terminal domain-containing protein [Ktedonobacteraceae bacterium]|nr:PLD nuclease N-terminal domain-containing protein [Ktedonobacteraceae bacterium]
MSANRGCFLNTVVFLVVVFFPLVGHIIASIMVLDDDHSMPGKVLWLLVIWLMPPFVVVGPLLYLLFGQRPRHGGRVTFGQPSYGPYQQYQRTY